MITKNMPCIGTKVSKAKLREMEDEVLKLSEEVLQDQQMQQSLKAAQGFERLNQSTDQILHLPGQAKNCRHFTRNRISWRRNCESFVKEAELRNSISRRQN